MIRLDGASRAQLSRRRADRIGRAPFVDAGREPAGRARRITMRTLITLLLPVRILSVIGLTVLVVHIVRERGDVGSLVWLQLVVLAMLSWTVWLHASLMVRRIGWVRRLGASRHRPARPALPTDRVPLASLRSAAPADVGTASRAAAFSARSRRGVAGASWWLLLSSVVGICLLFMTIVARWMVSDLREDGAGPWLIAQLVLLVAAVIAIGWTVRCALTSVARPGSRRLRPQVQRFLNWLLRLLTLGRRGYPAVAGSSSPIGPPTGAWSMSFIAQIGALTLLATGVLGVGVATATIENDGSAPGNGEGAAAGPEDAMSGDSSEEGSAGDVAAESEDTSGRPAADSSTTAPIATMVPVDDTAVVSTGFEAPTTSSPNPTPTSPGTVPSTATTSAPPPATVASTIAAPVSPNTPPSTSEPSPTSTRSPIITAAPTTSPTVMTTTTFPRTAITTTTFPRTAITTTTTTTTPCAPIGADPDCDGDGVSNRVEIRYGSDYQNPRSRPEHREYDPATCTDRVDNDLDGATDSSDPGCAGG